MHTNPILICFCSILYYRDLAEHIKNFNKEKKRLMANTRQDKENVYFLKKFGNKMARRVTLDTIEKQNTNENMSLKNKIYNKTYVNKWHLLIRLCLNKELIQFRKHNIKRKAKKESESMFTKLTTKCCSKLKSRNKTNRKQMENHDNETNHFEKISSV